MRRDVGVNSMTVDYFACWDRIGARVVLQCKTDKITTFDDDHECGFECPCLLRLRLYGLCVQSCAEQSCLLQNRSLHHSYFSNVVSCIRNLHWMTTLNRNCGSKCGEPCHGHKASQMHQMRYFWAVCAEFGPSNLRIIILFRPRLPTGSSPVSCRRGIGRQPRAK